MFNIKRRFYFVNRGVNAMGKKHKLKPISFYGHKLEEVLRAFMQVKPEKIKEQLNRGNKQKR